MPFYEYRRPDGTTIEVMQRMTDPPLTEDPETGVPLERVFHPIAVHFKGKGFYNTDYGTKKRAREKAETDTAAKTSDTPKTDAAAQDSKAVQKLDSAKSATEPSKSASKSKSKSSD